MSRIYIVAELSANHAGSFEHAAETIRASAKSGADAIKIQTYTADTLTIDCDNKFFRIHGGTMWDGRTLYDLYKEAYTPWEWHADLKTVAEECGLEFFSTPFDGSAVDFLEDLGVHRYKVASFELVDEPLLKRIGRTKKPVIMSTGMASVVEIQMALEVLCSNGCPDVTLLKCTSAYPAEPEDANLLTIPDMRERFACPVGVSDHTRGIAVPVTAVALGCCMVEKHLTLNRLDGGPDSSFSLEPLEFRNMVDAVREAQKALGKVLYGGTGTESKSKAFRRSLFVVEGIKCGEVFTDKNVRSIRPAYGLPPARLSSVIGCHAARDISRGTPMSDDLIQETLDGRDDHCSR